MAILSAIYHTGYGYKVPFNQLQSYFLPKRYAGFQAAQSNLSLEMKMRLIERKKKKIEKLSKQPLEFIPVTDFYIPYSWKLKSRKRIFPKLSDEKQEERVLLQKEYCKLVGKKRIYSAWRQILLKKEQDRALRELEIESPELHEEALKCLDLTKFEFSCRGPVQTLPLNNYLAPLGGVLLKDPPFDTDEPNIPDS